jgi:hypothetical protein
MTLHSACHGTISFIVARNTSRRVGRGMARIGLAARLPAQGFVASLLYNVISPRSVDLFSVAINLMVA